MTRTARRSVCSAVFLWIMLASTVPVRASAGQQAAVATDFEVVTSMPMDTTISGAGTRAAATVWPLMIAGARNTLDIAQFYLSSEKGEALEPVVEAILAAGRRGVKVRILSDAAMAKTYPGDAGPLSGQARHPDAPVRLEEAHRRRPACQVFRR